MINKLILKKSVNFCQKKVLQKRSFFLIELVSIQQQKKLLFFWKIIIKKESLPIFR